MDKLLIQKVIKNKVQERGIMGMALVGGAAALLGVVVAATLVRK